MAHASIHEIFRQAAGRFPDHTAVEWDGGWVSYRRLDAFSNLLADRLLAAGAARGSLVGVLASRSVDVIAAMLGTLKAGCAFMPVDPAFQVASLEQVAAEGRPRWWLAAPSQSERLERLHSGQDSAAAVIPLAEAWTAEDGDGATRPVAVPLDPDGLAYVYFTSGSTGRPKGIAGRLKAIDHYVRWMTKAFGVGEGSRFSQLISPAWDGFLLDAFVPLAAGGTVCAPGGRETLLDGGRLRDWIDGQRLNLIHCTPSLFRSLLKQDLTPAHFPALRCVLLVGEPLLPSDVRRWYAVFGERVELVNLYGPSETTLTKLFYRVTAADGDALSIPIGKPMPGARVVVLDDEGRPCPPDRLGEIYIRTPYRALGYLNQPELTAQVFLRNPLSDRPDDIVYRTGDLGRMRADGNLEFAGRRDRQIKIRGVRIELAPIEDLLLSHEAVAEAAVVDRDDTQGNKFLCAYVALGRELETSALRGFLLERLPELLVPSAFVVLDALPRTPTGKVDRRGLPDPGQVGGRIGGEYAAPRTPVEEELCAIFSELLRVPRVGIHDNFFELGGHSLLVSQLLARAQRSLGQLPLGQVFETPTVAGLALAVTRHRWPADEIGPRPATADAFPLSFSQQRLWFVDQLEVENSSYNISQAVRLRGRLHRAALQRALDEVVRRQESLRTVFAERGGQPFQVVEPARPIEIPLVDLQSLAHDRREPEARRIVTEDSRRPFDLGRGPLIRCRLLRLAGREHVLAFVLHHIIADGWSLVVLVRDLTLAYLAFVQGQPSPLREPPIQYRDFALWQRDWLQGETLARELSYWRNKLAGAPTFVRLPTDHPRPPVQSSRGSRELFELPPDLTASLERLSRTERGCTLFMVLLSAFALLVHGYSGEDDLVVSGPISGRNRSEYEGLIGFLANTLLFRIDLSGNPTFRQLLSRVRDTVLEAYVHQHLPLERAVQEVAPERTRSYSPLLQLGLNFVHHDLGGVSVSGELAAARERTTAFGLAVEAFDFEYANASSELNVILAYNGRSMNGSLHYRTDLFERGTIVSLLDQFRYLLGLVAEKPDLEVRELEAAVADREETRRRAEKRRLEQVAGRSFQQRRRMAVGGEVPGSDRG